MGDFGRTHMAIKTCDKEVIEYVKGLITTSEDVRWRKHEDHIYFDFVDYKYHLTEFLHSYLKLLDEDEHLLTLTKIYAASDNGSYYLYYFISNRAFCIVDNDKTNPIPPEIEKYRFDDFCTWLNGEKVIFYSQLENVNLVNPN